jgi:plasmid maintenance system antidote protein VapI
MKELDNIESDIRFKYEDPIGVLKIIKKILRLKTKDFAIILSVPIPQITDLLAKRRRLTEDEAKKLATHFDIDIFYFGRWYRIDSDPDYWDDPKIRAEIISLTAYLRFGYEKLINDYPNHPFIPTWKNTWGDWINFHVNITEHNGGMLLESKQEVDYEINLLKKEKRKLHSILNEIKKYGITG